MPESGPRLSSHLATGEQAGMRLDVLWTQELEDFGLSRSQVSRWIKQARARVNGRPTLKPSAHVQAGDRLELEWEPPVQSVSPRSGLLEVIHEDRDLVAVNKPPGLSVHPAPSIDEPTLVHFFVHSFPEAAELDPVRPGVVHRLDKDTSGLLILARNQEARDRIAHDLAERKVHKEYLALVHGCPEPAQQRIELPLGRDPQSRTRMAVLKKNGRQAVTELRTLHAFPGGRFSLLKLRILTGRTHQIRVHLAHAGHPVLGDRLYGSERQAGLDREQPVLARLAGRQMLHAWKLGFDHPVSGRRIELTQPAPRDFWRLALLLDRRVQKVGVTGSVGCGKSTVADLLGQGHHPVWKADAVVAGLYEPGQDGWELLRARYGQRFVPDPGAGVDKKALFSAMQESDEVRQEVMHLVHPMVRVSLQRFFESHARARLAVAEVPLLVESGWHTKGGFDALVGVSCPYEQRMKRLEQNRGWDRSLIESMESWQAWEQDKLAPMDLIVRNDGSLENLAGECARVRTSLLQRRRRSMLSFFKWLKEIEVA